jgi:alanine-glyoxylate transaminase/serine-glyoxylate transaminase/serine-pyruvate transaminase
MAGMEACIANTVSPGDHVVVVAAGYFGERIAELALRMGTNVTVVRGEWVQTVEPAQLRATLEAGPAPVLVAAVHAETSTGVRQDLAPLAAIAHEAGALFLADMVTSLGGIAVEADSWGVDIAYSAVQKCVGAPPGLSPVTVSEAVLERAQKANLPRGYWFSDFKLLGNYYNAPHMYHHTVPVNNYYALDAALTEAFAEGLNERFARHQAASGSLLNGLAQLGVNPLAPKDCRLPTLNAVTIPDNVDDQQVRTSLLIKHGIEIGGGLGKLKGKIWRIGTMGHTADLNNVERLLAAMKTELQR